MTTDDRGCGPFEALLYEALDETSGGLPEPALVGHLKACASCRRLQGELRALHRASLGEPLLEPPPELRARVLARLPAREPTVLLRWTVALEAALLGGAAAAFPLLGLDPARWLDQATAAAPPLPDQVVLPSLGADHLAALWPAELLGSLEAAARSLEAELAAATAALPSTWLWAATALLLLATLAADVLVPVVADERNGARHGRP